MCSELKKSNELKLTSAYDDVGAVKSDLSLPWLGKAGEEAPA